MSPVVAEKLDFDARIHAAKSLIDECLKDWIDGGRAELRPIVCDAFNVDKQGRLNTKQILALRRYNISDDRWKRAMEAISDSLYVSGSKSYVRIHKRTESGEYKQVNLDVYRHDEQGNGGGNSLRVQISPDSEELSEGMKKTFDSVRHL